MKNEEITLEQIRENIVAMHDKCKKAKKRCLLDRMLSIYLAFDMAIESMDDNELLGEMLYSCMMDVLDQAINFNEKR